MRPVDPRLVRHDPAVRSHLALTAVVGVLLGLLLVAQAALIARVVTAVFLEGAQLGAVSGSLTLLAAVIVVRGLVVAVREDLGHHVAAGTVARLRSELLRHTARLGPVGLSQSSRGELVATATVGLDALAQYVSGYLPQLVLAVVVPVVLLVRLVPVDGTAVAVMAVTVPLIPVFMALVGLATEAATNRRWRTLTRLSAHFLDVVEGLPTLRSHRRVRHQVEVLTRVGEDYRRVTLETLRWSFLSALVLELLATLGVALVAVIVGLRVVAGELGLEPALTVLVLAPEVYLPLRQVGARFHQAQEGLAAADRAFAVLATPPPGAVAATAEPAGAADEDPADTGAGAGCDEADRGDRSGGVPDLRRAPLRLDAVTVAYPGRSGAAFAPVSTTLHPGDLVHVTGPSGAGKTTLTLVLLAFARPSTGQVTIGDPPVDLTAVDPDAWRRQLAWVPQHPHLLTATVADNVRLADPAADDRRVRAALADAHVLPEIEALPRGIDTPLAENGTSLSAGQRRRAALAPPSLRRPALVVVDEPAAGLDADAAGAVLAALDRLRLTCTLVLAAHRPLLPGGQVIDLGARPAPPSATDAATAPPASAAGERR